MCPSPVSWFDLLCSFSGEQKLHYMSADPARVDATTTVPLPKEGPVHDVQWSPNGEFFVTVAGYMPAKVGQMVGLNVQWGSVLCMCQAASLFMCWRKAHQMYQEHFLLAAMGNVSHYLACGKHGF